MSEPKSMGNQAQSQNQRARAKYTSPKMTVRPDKHNTEGGLSPAEVKTLLAEENRAINAFKGKYEIAAVVDREGNLNPKGNPMVKGGKGANRFQEVQHGARNRVSTRSDRRPENTTYTHTHPWDNELQGTGLGAKIGISFSGDDIANAISRNNSSTRARTPGYVFSLRRPAGGWNADSKRVMADWYDVYNREAGSMAQTILNVAKRNGGMSRDEINVRKGRMNALASHRATKAVADKYGFIYTRRKA